MAATLPFWKQGYKSKSEYNPWWKSYKESESEKPVPGEGQRERTKSPKKVKSLTKMLSEYCDNELYHDTDDGFETLISKINLNEIFDILEEYEERSDKEATVKGYSIKNWIIIFNSEVECRQEQSVKEI